MIDYEAEAAWHYLCSLNKIGIATVDELLEYTGNLLEVLELDAKELKETGFMNRGMLDEWEKTSRQRYYFREEYEVLKEKSYRFISCQHPEFPEKYKNIQMAPHGIWLKGKLAEDSCRCAAIVGSRECTTYGKEVAGRIGELLAEWGIGVISGMAIGIDAAGQWGALKKGGYTAGVLGCGVDIIYPYANRNLYYSLESKGGIISEFAPGTSGWPQNFRQRNRLISGLADCVIVVEARKKSGTQLTVSWALDQGKDIFCIPGRITDEFSQGCNQMIYQGATIIDDFNVLKEYFGITGEKDKKKETVLSEDEKNVLNILNSDMLHFEQLLIRSNMKTGILWQILFDLENKQLISQPVKNYFRKKL